MASEEQKHRVRSLRMYATRRALVLLVPLAAVVVLLVNREESEPPVTLTPRPRETERVLVRSDAQPVPPQQTPSSTPARQPTTAPTSFMPESTTAVPTMTGAPATAAATATPHTPQPGGIPREPLLNQSRVAICLAGGVRSLRLVAPSIRSNLIEALRGGLGHFVHVFLEISTEQDCFANYNNVATTAECVEYARRAAAWAHKASNITRAFRGASVTVNIVNQFNCSHPFVQSHVCCVRENGRAMNDKGEGFVWGMAQYMRRRLCYDRIKQHEAEIGKAFDLVVITRPDMLFLEPLPPAQWFLSSLPRIYAMSKDDGWGDYLFIAPRSLSDDLDRVFDQCFTTPCSEPNPNRGLPPEARLGPALEHGHPHHRFPFQAVIRRSEIRADCWRLANGINDVGRYLSPSSGNLAYRHDVCKEQYPLRIPPP